MQKRDTSVPSHIPQHFVQHSLATITSCTVSVLICMNSFTFSINSSLWCQTLIKASVNFFLLVIFSFVTFRFRRHSRSGLNSENCPTMAKHSVSPLLRIPWLSSVYDRMMSHARKYVLRCRETILLVKGLTSFPILFYTEPDSSSHPRYKDGLYQSHQW